MNEDRIAEVRCSDGVKLNCLLQVDIGEKCCLTLSEQRIGTLTFLGSDVWGALRMLRESLEAKGMFILCQGARRNIVCSGMSRSMGGGRKGYLVEFGHPTNNFRLIDILDRADDCDVGTVTQQDEFRVKWLESLRRVQS